MENIVSKMKKKKLNIVFVDFDDIQNPLLGAGQARATVEVGKRLINKEHKVTVICSRFPGYQDRIENGIHYRHIGLGTPNIRVNNAAFILAAPFAVRKAQADIMVECFTAPISTLFSPVFTKTPVVGLPSMFNAKAFSKKYYLPFHWVEWFGLRFYKYFLPYTEYFDQKMRKVNPKVVSKIIPEGVGEEFFKIEKRKPKHILFLGRLDIGQKGIDLLLEAYAQVVKKIKYPLVIVGGGPDEAKVKALIRKLKLEKSVRMLGPVYGEKKNQILAETLFFALSTRHETFSCVALEALASGLPIVCFDIPGLRWMDRTVSFKAKAFDIDAYAHLLVKATHEDVLQKVTKNTRHFSQRFTWEKVADDFESFFFEVLDKEKGD